MNWATVYRVDPSAGVVYGIRGKPLGRRSKGYVLVANRQRGWCKMAHRMIWESVNGPIPDGLQINHINGDKSDNRIANLEIVTPSENVAHAYRTGLTSASGEANGRAKLTWPDVYWIRYRVSQGETKSALAREYGVAHRTITDLVQRKTWRSR